MELVKKLMPWTIILGVVGFIFISMFGTQAIIFINSRQVNGLTFYSIDVLAYTKNLKDSIGGISALIFPLPNRKWENITGNVLQEQFWKSLVNNLAMILNMIIVLANALLYPLKVGAYAVKQVLAILGVNMSDSGHGLTWLVYTANILINMKCSYV